MEENRNSAERSREGKHSHRGNLLIFLGMILIFGALGLTVYNILDGKRAEKAAEQISVALIDKIKEEDSRYGKAAYLMIVSAVLQTVADLMGENAAILSVVILIPALVLSLMATYQEYCAHSSVVGSADTFLGQRWMTLWKWQIVSIGGLLVSTLLLIVVPPLGALLMVVGVIAIVAGVLTLVNLYKSAQAFRKMTA